LPVVLPVVDYNKRINGPEPLGGEVAIDVNFTSLTREAAAFSNLPNRLFGLFPGYLYESCAVYQRGQCLLRGISGSDTRLSAQVSWRRDFTDSIGQVWTPFAYARTDAFFVRPDTTGYPNNQLPSFIGSNDEFVGRAVPAVGLEYRYPLVADGGAFGTHILEPTAQIIARPNETRIGRLPNEDAQSLVFDDSSLFNWDKFTGYDRAEGGVRANLGCSANLSNSPARTRSSPAISPTSGATPALRRPAPTTLAVSSCSPTRTSHSTPKAASTSPTSA
jgi:LPS-assembly protein